MRDQLATPVHEEEAQVIDLDPQDVDTIILRWQEFSGGAAILDGDGRSYEQMLDRGEAPGG